MNSLGVVSASLILSDIAGLLQDVLNLFIWILTDVIRHLDTFKTGRYMAMDDEMRGLLVRRDSVQVVEPAVLTWTTIDPDSDWNDVSSSDWPDTSSSDAMMGELTFGHNLTSILALIDTTEPDAANPDKAKPECKRPFNDPWERPDFAIPLYPHPLWGSANESADPGSSGLLRDWNTSAETRCPTFRKPDQDDTFSSISMTLNK